MKTLLGSTIAVAVLVVLVQPANAQTRGTSTSRLRMVRAHCTTGPCDPFLTFQSGSAMLKRVNQPKLVTNLKIGKVRLSKLQPDGFGGPPVPSTLTVRVSGTIFYGSDTGAACGLANTVVSGPFATSTMSCLPGGDGTANCSGTLFVGDATDPECSDVTQVIQDLNVEIYEGGFVGVPERLIATTGMNILGKSPDCASGGSGCP